MTGNVSYELIDEQGPDHNKIFEVEARIGEKPGTWKRKLEEVSRAAGSL